MGMGLNIELISDGLPGVERVCPQCGSTLRLMLTAEPPEWPFIPTVQHCPICDFAIGMGVSIEVIEAKPWSPEEEIPITGIADWLKKYGPWIAVAGAGAVTLYVATKKK